MNKRTIKLEFNETYLALLEDHAAEIGYENAEDYLSDLIAKYAFDRLERLYGSNSDMEWEDCKGLTDPYYIDDLPC